jgi:hypothetical protein
LYLVGELALQVEVLLTPVMDFDAHTGDASYTVGVVSLLLNCIQLSCRSGICSDGLCVGILGCWPEAKP